jgi:hypothetical protein
VPKVYVTQETNVDYVPAQRYGDIEFITRQGADEVADVYPSLHNEDIVRRVRRKLRRYDPVEDWIVVSGSPYVAAICFMALGARKVPYVQLLKWSNMNRVYVPVRIDMREREEIGNG